MLHSQSSQQSSSIYYYYFNCLFRISLQKEKEKREKRKEKREKRKEKREKRKRKRERKKRIFVCGKSFDFFAKRKVNDREEDRINKYKITKITNK